ncbi:MAG: hypothetical protein GQ547_07555 [Methylophaga sp.]|nr:hypothetical protein [Methylophaga sp.]
MTTSSDLSKILSPLIAQSHCKSVLLAGETVINSCKELQDTRSHALKTPFSLEQLNTLPTIDLAIISDLIETLPKQEAILWLSMVRNRHAQHLVLVTNNKAASEQGWQIADYLALGLQQHGSLGDYQLFSYNIESYRPKRDWLNNRFWANPENYDKYRW